MSGDNNSTPQGFFGSELQRLRESAGMTQPELADALRYSLDTIKSVETGRLLGSDKLAQAADALFGTDGRLERLRGFVDHISMRRWFRDRMILEQQAAAIWEYEPYGVSGLLQTESYVRAMARAERPALSRDEVEEAVRLRLERQRILDREEPPHLWVVMEEAVLNREIGGQGVMTQQREYLLRQGGRPNVTIQVVPRTAGTMVGVGRPFSVLMFETASNVVYLEELEEARYVRESAKVMRYALAYDHLRASALDEQQTADLIRKW
jgi:transcriptional regulator with XRE-family HTH domain